MNLNEILFEYFIKPMQTGEGYNLVNTSTFAFLFVFMIYLTYKVLKRLEIKADEKLAIAIVPYIITGCIFRVLKDANVLKSYLLITPSIYFLFLGIILLAISISIFLERKLNLPYYKTMFIFGFISMSFSFGLIKIINPTSIFYVSIAMVPILILLKIIKTSVENKIILGVHLFDSIVTAIAVKYFNYFELHVLPKFLIESTGEPFVFVLVKFIVVFFSLFFIDRYSDDKDFSNYVKIIIGILGLIPGARDFIRLLWLT